MKRHAITIHLSHAQRIAIEELKLIRMAKTKKKPTLRELLTEGLCLLLKKEKIKLEDE